MNYPPSWIIEDMHATSRVGSRNVFLLTVSAQYELKTRLWLLSQIQIDNTVYHLISNSNSVLLLGWGEICIQFVRHGSTFLAIVTPSMIYEHMTIWCTCNPRRFNLIIGTIGLIV